MRKEVLIQDIIESLGRCQRSNFHSMPWEKLDLSHAQLGMLFLISYHKRSSVKEIAGLMGVTKSAVTQIMAPLIDKGLVRRRLDIKDRRIAHLSLAPKGRRLIKNLSRHKSAGLRTALYNLSDKDLEQIHSIFSKMISQK